MEYQTTPIEPGGWYISDPFPIDRTSDPSHIRTGPTRERLRIKGPLKSESEATIEAATFLEANPMRGPFQIWQAAYTTADFETTLSEAIGIIANADADRCYSNHVIVKAEVRKRLFANNAIASCFGRDDRRHDIGKKIENFDDERKHRMIDKMLNIL